MKELLSIEEKAKAYDEAIKRASNLHKDAVEMENNMTTKTCEIIFPELKESEDEKMRAMAIKAVYSPEAQSCIKSWGVNPEDVIAWLEKQCEQKHVDLVAILKNYFANTPKEQREKDWAEIKHLNDVGFDAEISFGAKDSDLQEATYFIPDGFHAEIIGDKVVIKQGEQKSAWSEEDEYRLNEIILDLKVFRDTNCSRKGKAAYQREIDWLEFLKNKVQPQPKQEWSEEDEKTVHLACEFIRHHSRPIDSIGGIDCSELIERLKTIKEKCAFNLSDEQIEALSAMVKYCDIATSFNAHKQRIVESLYQALKKLRKE